MDRVPIAVTVRATTLVVAFVCLTLSAASPALEEARRLYEKTDYEAAIAKLRQLPDKGAAVWALIGRAYLGAEEYKEATQSLEKAVEAEPANAGYWNWLGLACVERADNSSFLTAASHASRGRKAFEKAVGLDPTDLDAAVNLFSYYLEAPGIVGGGVGKAEAMAEKVKEIHEGEYHYTQAELAKKRKDYTAAETHFRQAMKLEPERVGRVLDLARFLSERARFEESDKLFDEAQLLAPNAPKVLFAKAKTFTKANRRLDEARQLLERYIKADLTPKDPRRSEAVRLLKKM